MSATGPVAGMRRKRKPSEDKFRFAEWFYFRKIRQLERSEGETTGDRVVAGCRTVVSGEGWAVCGRPVVPDVLIGPAARSR